MKKVLTWLASLGLIASSATSLTSCSISQGINKGIYDENWKKVDYKDSDSQQWDDIIAVNLFMMILSKEVFHNSESFYEMNGKNSEELLKNYFRDSNGNKIDDYQFNYNFSFLITNYESISVKVVEQMKQLLQNQTSGIYLFLNLPLNQRTDDLQKAKRIIFEFIFMIKIDDQKIMGNNYNDWFYWYFQDNINHLDSNSDQKYFFDLSNDVTYLRVITTLEYEHNKFWLKDNKYKNN